MPTNFPAPKPAAGAALLARIARDRGRGYPDRRALAVARAGMRIGAKRACL
jgi:hypothetical protein